MELTARAALHHPSFGRAGAGEIARRCPFASAAGPARPHALALNALKNLATAWRDVPAEAREAFDASLGSLLGALDLWPAHLKAAADELGARHRGTARERTPRTPPRPYYLDY